MEAIDNNFGIGKYLSNNFHIRHVHVHCDRFLKGHHYFILEIEREYKSLSMFILGAQQGIHWDIVIEQLLGNLVKDNGAWLKESLKEIEDKGVTVQKAKHSKKNYEHRAKLLLSKII
ncbi:Tn7-like element transposition protein TnsE [Aerococcus sp. L_32]|uniref:Tn7-like element transposition protein TnsE n=1 Tax=Aerococcus sp. L_32 TaxID=3422316 RepID=UPI003D6AD56B